MRKSCVVSLVWQYGPTGKAKLRRIHNRHLDRHLPLRVAKLCVIILFVATPGLLAQSALKVSVDHKSGSYSIAAPGIGGSVLAAGPAILVDGKWIAGRDYPQHRVQEAQVDGPLGSAREQTVSYSGLAGAPDLTLRIRTYSAEPFGEIQLTARNTAGAMQHIERFRLLDAAGQEILHLGGDPASDRVLSDSFSEDRPAMQLRDLGDA
jgi:alpha-galactosidase